MFDGELGIALHTMQGNWASSRSEVIVSLFFSSCGGNLRYILELWWGWLLKTRVCSALSGLLSSFEGHLGNIHEAWQGNTDASQVELGDQVSLSSYHRDIRIPIYYQEKSGIVYF